MFFFKKKKKIDVFLLVIFYAKMYRNYIFLLKKKERCPLISFGQKL